RNREIPTKDNWDEGGTAPSVLYFPCFTCGHPPPSRRAPPITFRRSHENDCAPPRLRPGGTCPDGLQRSRKHLIENPKRQGQLHYRSQHRPEHATAAAR